jgi:hypothetical protein
MRPMKNAVHLLLLAGWTPLAAVVVHAGTLLVLALLPRLSPLSLLRFGLDVLRSA